MIIDTWMQHPNHGWISNSMFDSLRRWKPGRWSETSQPIDETLAEMDRANVSLGMLCAWHGPTGPIISNDEVAQHCRAHPDRFVGIASVDLYRPMDAVRELRRRVKRDGFKGLRVLPWLSEMLSLVMKYPNVFIDTSAYKASRYPHELVTYMRGNPKHRVLFGSNHPFWPAGECIAGLDRLELGDAAHSAFLAGNARRCFKIG